MDTAILEEIGLTRNEGALFLAVIHEPLSATELAKRLGLNRSYVYYALERLLEKGYISEITMRSKRHFRAVPLNYIETAAEHRLEMMRSMFARLREKKPKNEDISVEVLKGKYVMRNVYKMALKSLEEGEDFLTLGGDEGLMERLEPIYFEKILRYLATKGIPDRCLVKKGTKLLDSPNTEYRYLDPSLFGSTMRYIYGDTVIDFFFGTSVYAIVVRNREIARAARQQFEMFWKLAENP